MISSFFLSRPYASAAAVGSVDDALHLETGDLAGVLGGLALGVVEVRRDGDDRRVDLLADVILGGLLQLHEDTGADLLRRQLLATDVELGVTVAGARRLVRDALQLLADLFVAAPDETLGAEDGVLRVGDGLTLGDLADQDLALVVPGRPRSA